MHVIRVNSAFGTKYTENDNAMAAAKSAVDPAAGLKLLKLPAQDVETAADKEEMAADAAEPNTFFLELHQSNIAKLGQALYDVAMANSQQTKQNIEKERSTLGKFRDMLRALILKREAKLAKLTKQLADINAALETNESFAKDVWPYLIKHYEVTQKSCTMMQGTFTAAEAAEQEVITAIQSGSDKGAGPSEVPIEAVSDAGLKPIARVWGGGGSSPLTSVASVRPWGQSTCIFFGGCYGLHKQLENEASGVAKEFRVCFW